MALANFKPEVAAREVPHEKAVVADLKKHEIYDHRLQPLFSLDAFLQGSPWQVTYFRQRLGQNDPTQKLDPGMAKAYQSYDQYNKYELLVQSAISPSYRDKEHLMEVTGSALMYSFMVPNIDDYFIAESNLARMGLFRITNVNRRTHEKESIYIVEYAIEDQLTPEHELFMDIHRKVTTQYIFSKQRLIENKNPILLQASYEVMQDMYSELRHMYRMYFRDFSSVQTASLQIPGQKGRHVDPYVLDFLTQIVSVYEAPEIERLRFVSVDNNPVYEKPTLWSMLLHRRVQEMSYLTKYMGKINPQHLYGSYFARSGCFASADYVIRPKTVDTSSESESFVQAKNFSPICSLDLDLTPTKDAAGEMVTYEDLVYDQLPEVLPLILPVSNTTYILSEGFYAEEPQSVLEILVLDYIRLKPLEPRMLTQVVKMYPRMGRLEQFYYGPILMVLIKENERSAYV